MAKTKENREPVVIRMGTKYARILDALSEEEGLYRGEYITLLIQQKLLEKQSKAVSAS